MSLVLTFYIIYSYKICHYPYDQGKLDIQCFSYEEYRTVPYFVIWYERKSV